ncbi:MAG: hypothetical protein P8R54_14990 [Myxococcota bacterium]|nr:hypothetical protein [Myxococcota bacterium]
MATAATEPSLPTVGRYRLPAVDGRPLLSRQLTWTACQAAAAAGLTAAGFANGHPALAVGGSLSAAVLAIGYRSPAKAAAIVAATLGGIWTLSLLPATNGGAVGISGVQVLLAGGIIGAGLAWMRTDLDRWQLIQTTLAGIATVGLGWWASIRLLGGMPTEPLAAGLHGVLFGLLASQLTVVAALRYSVTQRIPSPRRIKAALAPQYQPPCIKAHRLDTALAAHASDDDIRDGLGEVAAWIYKLQWSLQVIDREIEAISDMDLQTRIAQLYADAEQSDDEFVVERCVAAAGHLEKLRSHREGLAQERNRVAALVEYAAAYQEEARAGLVLARMQPGDYIPARLNDVLGRLRAHAQAQRAARDTARELAGFAHP